MMAGGAGPLGILPYNKLGGAAIREISSISAVDGSGNKKTLDHNESRTIDMNECLLQTNHSLLISTDRIKPR